MPGARFRRWTTAIAGVLCCAAAAGCGSGSSTHTQTTAAINSAERTQLRRLAETGGPIRQGRPTDIEAVRTTYAHYQQVLGGPPAPGAGDVYVIGMRANVKLPSGRSFPYLVLVVDAKTNRRLIAVPQQTPPQLSRLGPVTKL